MVWFVVVGALALLGPVTVGEADPDHRVDTIDDFAIEPLDTAEGALPTAPPWEPAGPIEAPPRDPSLLGDKIMFINFDGADLQSCGGNDSPVDNCSRLWNGSVDPYSGDAAKRASIIQIVRQRVENFGITVTDQRPGSGDYDMEMVGNWSGVDPDSLGFAGVAPSIDCFDSRGGETSFTLEKAGTSDGVAEIILQEIAHTWGLEHIDSQGDLLYPTTQGTNKVFLDECLKIVQLDANNMTTTPVNGQCNNMHTNFCDSGWQNSAQELLALFGPSIPDTFAPTIQILSPADGETLEGGDVDLVIGFADDQSPAVINAIVTLESAALDAPVEEDGAYAAPAELTFPLSGLPDGEYTVSVEGSDEADNPASDSVSFTVIGGMPQGTSGGTTGDSGNTGDSAGGTSGGSGDPASGGSGNDSMGEDTDTDMAGEDGDLSDRGCGCTAEDAAPVPRRAGWLLMIVAPLLVRRRRA
jgi:MYXO-CTERM domain-containing protein